MTGHFVQYRDAEDLERQFAVSERRAAIGAAAQAIVLGRHTYDHRAAGIVARMRAALVGDGAGEAGHSGKRMRE